jgi:hypothetical protein
VVTKIDKAIVAFILGTAGSLGTVSAAGGSVSTTALVTALIIGLIAAAGVWAVPNKAA